MATTLLLDKAERDRINFPECAVSTTFVGETRWGIIYRYVFPYTAPGSTKENMYAGNFEQPATECQEGMEDDQILHAHEVVEVDVTRPLKVWMPVEEAPPARESYSKTSRRQKYDLMDDLSSYGVHVEYDFLKTHTVATLQSMLRLAKDVIEEAQNEKSD